MKKRILFSDNGTLTDYSVNLQNYHSGNTASITWVAAEDYLFIGTRLPFNHIYIKFNGTNVNANASVLSIAYWDGGDFRDVVDLIDETSSGGATFAQSGFVTWSTDKSYGWTREDTNYSGQSVTGLTSVEIYDLYWCRLAVSANLTAGVQISWLGQKFANDDDLGSEYPSLIRSGFLTAYEAGKTTWEEQHVTVADLIIEDLIDRSIILEGDQILQREDLRNVAVSRLAQLIFTGMGDDYEKSRELAKSEYEKRLNRVLPRIDQNANARIDVNERLQTGRLIR